MDGTILFLNSVKVTAAPLPLNIPLYGWLWLAWSSVEAENGLELGMKLLPLPLEHQDHRLPCAIMLGVLGCVCMRAPLPPKAQAG